MFVCLVCVLFCQDKIWLYLRGFLFEFSSKHCVLLPNLKLVGPVVLQIQKTRNVSAPKANEESAHAPRLLKLQLTDGHTTCHALELDSIPQLSLSTPPGTKVCISGAIDVHNGFLALTNSNTKVLGGNVEKLVAKWELSKVNNPYENSRSDKSQIMATQLSLK